MSIRNIRRQATAPLGATASAAPIYVDSDDNRVKVIPAGSGSTEVELLNHTGIVSVTATVLAVTKALHSFKTLVLNVVAGCALQLPAATGSGDRYRFVVGTASNANVLSAVVATDIFSGGYIQNDTGASAAVTADFMEAAATDNTYSPTTAGGGGLVGDWFEIEDIAAGVWQFRGMNKGTIDPTTRFSHV